MITQEKKIEKVVMAKAHRAEDRLRSGHYTHSEDSEGCSVGCDAYDIRLKLGDDWGLDENPEGGIHEYVSSYFGTPEWLEYLRDVIFEGLSAEDRVNFHVDLAESLPVGVGFDTVYHKIQRDILLEIASKNIGDGDENWRVKCRDAVSAVAKLHDRAIAGKVGDEEWSAARSAAWALGAAGAARSARSARSAAWALGAAGAARSAVDAAEAAAWAAAWAAVQSEAARSARSAAWKTVAEIVLRNLREAAKP